MAANAAAAAGGGSRRRCLRGAALRIDVSQKPPGNTILEYRSYRARSPDWFTQALTHEDAPDECARTVGPFAGGHYSGADDMMSIPALQRWQRRTTKETPEWWLNDCLGATWGDHLVVRVS